MPNTEKLVVVQVTVFDEVLTLHEESCSHDVPFHRYILRLDSESPAMLLLEYEKEIVSALSKEVMRVVGSLRADSL